MKKGLLLINLGTPSAAEPKAVGRYLREFLMDPLVIDVPALIRWFFVNVIIVPRRRYKSAHAYRQIWRPEGSPLLLHSLALLKALSREMGSGWLVKLGMRYGEPSIRQVLFEFQQGGIRELYILPLYPQFADSSTTTGLLKVQEELRGLQWNPETIKCLPHFFWFSGFIRATTKIMKLEKDNFRPDHLLFSYHGLPERHLTKRQDLKRVCNFDEKCCANLRQDNWLCYRAQCFETTRLLLKELGHPTEQSSIAFQSRLGRAKWIDPSLEVELKRLAEKGVKRLLVTCPSFVSDCLETLEEIGIRTRELFRSLGGEELKLVPCLNSDPIWVESFRELMETDNWLEFPRALELLQSLPS